MLEPTIDIPEGYRSTELGPLPEAWEMVRLEKIADFINGYAFKPDQWGAEGRPIIRIQNLTGTSDKINYFSGQLSEKYLVREGDLLISWSASLDAFIWAHGEAWLNQHIFKVDNISVNTHKYYLYYALRYYIETLRNKTRGSTMKHVTRKEFLATQLPLPPFSEQHVIANLLHAVERAIEAANLVIGSVRELKRSLMNHLFTYGPVSVEKADQIPLKETEFGPVPEHWEIVYLEELLREKLKNGYSARASHSDHGVRTFVLTAVTQNDFSTKNTKLTAAQPEKVKDLWAEPEDIFIERANTAELVGLAALYEGSPDFAIYPDLLVRVRVDKAKIAPYLVAQFLITKSSRDYFRRNARGTAGNMPKIDHGTIKSIPIPLPPLEEQYEINESMQRLDRKIAAEESRKQALEALFKALHHNLMTGKIRVHDLTLPTVEDV